MSNFAQKHTKISTLYLLSDENPNMELELIHHSKWKKAVLIIPLLASEYTLDENRPVFENIAGQLSNATYLSQIIFGLDQATTDDARELAKILNHCNVPNYLIQHNDGPGFSSIYKQLSDAGFSLDEPGKGRNMFMSFGIALAMGAQSIGLVDADIRTFSRQQLDRLFYPVQVLGYQFSKAFYARIKDQEFFGRVKRLLLDPLLIALKRKFTETQEEKVLRLVDFLLNFNYQLSGEVVFDGQLLKRMQFATNWGVEIFTLIEVYRKATNSAQVEISLEPFDHKHQVVSEEDRNRGLYKMGIDIVTTLLSALVIEEGLVISEHFIRDLTITYLSVADDLIKMYADNAAYSGLLYDTNKEEAMVDNVFKNVILIAGDLLLSPSFMVHRLSSYVTAHDDFKPFIDQGLLSVIEKTSQNIRTELYETPKTVSWERVTRKLPNIINEIVDVVESEKKLYR
jgi:glucosyl-3-phosphoglycerate synthase